MFGKSRVFLLALLGLLVFGLVGCGGSFLANETLPIASETVTAQLQFVDGAEVGPMYDVEVVVPADWVGQFETRNVGNKLYFEYATEAGGAEVFFIEALSMSQYWAQNGSHPGSYTNIVNRGDTYFIYHLPIDAYYSGLSDEDFSIFSAAVPGIVDSFSAQVAN
ncbi:MAG: hypothetical protein WAS33_08110 [Candidatus Promineifilaceae bacterium]|nr:hypothetical protein [Anaerolineaceae bacterium]